jgi:hypothetical protein
MLAVKIKATKKPIETGNIQYIDGGLSTSL